MKHSKVRAGLELAQMAHMKVKDWRHQSHMPGSLSGRKSGRAPSPNFPDKKGTPR